MYYSLEELKGMDVVVLTNMKASNFKGVQSQGLVLCAFK